MYMSDIPSHTQRYPPFILNRAFTMKDRLTVKIFIYFSL